MTRYLVTGATGGLGRNAVQSLVARGLQVRATGRDRHLGALLAVGGAEFVALDLAQADRQALASLLAGVDVVWHCAALAAPWGERDAFIAANVKATEALAAAAAQAGVKRFIYVSSPVVYFNFEHRYQVLEEFVASKFVNAYAESKLLAERSVRDTGAASTMRCVIMRPRAIFGPHDRVLMPRILRMHRRCGGLVFLPRGGRAILDVTYVDNVVHAMRLASESTLPEGVPTYNVTNNEPVELRQVLATLFRALGRRHRIVAVPYPVMAAAARFFEWLAGIGGKEPALTGYSVGALAFDLTIDTGRICRELGYRPIVTLEDGIVATADWLRKTDG